jgi:hypothetical protein
VQCNGRGESCVARLDDTWHNDSVDFFNLNLGSYDCCVAYHINRILL